MGIKDCWRDLRKHHCRGHVRVCHRKIGTDAICCGNYHEGKWTNIDDYVCDEKYNNAVGPACTDAMKAKCSRKENVTSEGCQRYCTKQIAENDSVCDRAITDYCSTDGVYDAKCDCINLKVEGDKITHEHDNEYEEPLKPGEKLLVKYKEAKECWLDACKPKTDQSVNPYNTVTIQSLKDQCTQCIQVIENVDIEQHALAANAEIEQKCGDKTSTRTGDAARQATNVTAEVPDDPGDSMEDEQEDQPLWKNKKVLLIGGGVIVVLLLLSMNQQNTSYAPQDMYYY